MLLYEMLHGDSLFQVKSIQEMKKCLEKPEFKISPNISSETKKFMMKMLKKDQKKRYDIKQVLNHPLMKWQKENFKPMSEEDKTFLVKNFLKNVQISSNKFTPEDVDAYLKKKKGPPDQKEKIEDEFKMINMNKPRGYWESFDLESLEKQIKMELKVDQTTPFLDFIQNENIFQKEEANSNDDIVIDLDVSGDKKDDEKLVKTEKEDLKDSVSKFPSHPEKNTKNKAIHKELLKTNYFQNNKKRASKSQKKNYLLLPLKQKNFLESQVKQNNTKFLRKQNKFKNKIALSDTSKSKH